MFTTMDRHGPSWIVVDRYGPSEMEIKHTTPPREIFDHTGPSMLISQLRDEMEQMRHCNEEKLEVLMRENKVSSIRG
ncbi:hypothetical protein VNO78_33979 [Psophocarpus tetragonolobus]|uniref:Uncharacterized protein n=1 Tax=Psophocarpus tetragonolobus TaxID=3891 RepID=A0AAN9RQZ8_PSOTE